MFLNKIYHIFVEHLKLIIMLVKKFDYSKSEEDIFYKIIYPIYSKEFLFGNDYNSFAIMLSGNFILNEFQWTCILEHWETKEDLLTYEHI